MTNLPFLKPKGVASIKKRTQAGESRYGFSEDDELIESTVDELMRSLEAKEHSKFIQSLMALINLIMNQEKEPADAGA